MSLKIKLLNNKILFLGCGKMGLAIIKNLLNFGFDKSLFTIVKPSRNNLPSNINYSSNIGNLDKEYQADIVIFAFKPKQVHEILSDFTKFNKFHKDTIFISILAGTNIVTFEEYLTKKVKIIRIMPNLPTMINEGIFGYFCNFDSSKKAKILPFLDAIGKNIEVSKEELLDSVTAISGSGPAYLFLFEKIMIKQAIELGFSKDDAERLVKQTIYGSSKMALNANLDELISSVASKGGTTEAALAVFNNNDNFYKIISKAINAAKDKAKILSK